METLSCSTARNNGKELCRSIGEDNPKKISIAAISHPANLRVITSKENSEKGKSKPFKVNQLFKNIDKFEETMKPFGTPTRENRYYEV